MTTISSMPYFSTMQRYAEVNRKNSNTGFADQMGQPTTSSSQTQSDKLTSLLAEADALQKKQVHMSNRDYLLANFTLQEQIAAERLKAGEDLNTFRVQFEGRVFNLAGKMLDLGSLESAKVSNAGMVQPAKPRDFTI
ncbi:hypothetical protein [Xaviernesmea oryzae]|uniref:hypothetical protein n=1 Tax=Rhizobium/Agrobacterium group TaxID=227290 RepID=UPI000A18C060|nr:hypothetical protein [Xaviernesmea oryzae]